MKGKKNVSVGLEGVNSSLIEELFPSNNGRQLVNLSVDSLAAIGRIIGYTASLGGTCTFYFAERDNCIGLSLRIAERKRSLLLAGDDADDVFLEQLANGIGRIYLEAEQLRNAEQLIKENGPTKKKGR